MGFQNYLLDKGTAYAQKMFSNRQEGPGSSNGQGFMQRQAMSMAKSAICKADVRKVKERLKMALDYMPDDMVASMIQSSPFCQSGGKRKTRKQKRKQRKTRKH
jgi:hypothetical protein